MDLIIRQPDGALVVPVEPDRHVDEDVDPADLEPTTVTLHPGEGGYDALRHVLVGGVHSVED